MKYPIDPLQSFSGAASQAVPCQPSYVGDTASPYSAMSYAAVIHSMDLGYCRIEVLEPDDGPFLDYRFLEVNPAYETQAGIGPLLGRRISEVVTEREPFWSHAFRQVIATGQMLHTTLTLRTVDRSFETWIICLGGPGSRQLAVLLKNITEQVQATRHIKNGEQRAIEQAAQAQLERCRLAAMLEATPAQVMVVDSQGHPILSNSEARQAWGEPNIDSTLQWVGHWAGDDRRHGQQLRPSDWPLQRALRGETVRESIAVTSPLNGQAQRTYLMSAAPIEDAIGSIDGAVLVALDITDRAQAERALRNASARKDEFLAMLAHELRNPLAPIAMAAELLGQPHPSHETLHENSAIIIRQVRHMRGLVDDLLDASRVSRGQIRIQHEPIEVAALVRDAIEQVSPVIEAQAHDLRLNLPQQAMHVQGDLKRLVQVLVNLLSNAAKYTPYSGRIEVQASQREKEVQIRISDNGIGMDAPTLENAFELFSQAERSVDRQQGGLGIGLALVRRLVELHGGRVQARSDGPGRGSQFTVWLPLAEEPARAPAQSQPAQPMAPIGQGLNILVVDDNTDAARTLSLFLQGCGHACAVAGNAFDALEMTRIHSPQFFILDIGLPGMDGRELARRLRQDPTTSSARIIALSGYAQPEQQAAALAAGFDHYLVKPVNADQLLRLLESAAS